MIKILVVKNELKPGFWGKITSLFAKNEVTQQVKYLGNTKINCITLKRKKMSIPWSKINFLFCGNCKNILCDESISLPKNRGFSRFCDNSFAEILCLNASKYVITNLNSNPENLSVVLYDPFGEYHHVLEGIVMYTRHIKIVTKNVGAYLHNIKNLADDYGACIPVSSSLSWLHNCNILIAPKIESKLCCSSSTVVFSCAENIVGLNGIVFNRYSLDVSSEISELIPSEIPPEYFVSALFCTNKFSKLRKAVPDYCASNGKIISINEVFRFVSLS